MSQIRIFANNHRGDYGLEYNFELFQRHDSASHFICACMDVLFNKTLFPNGLWIHKDGREGYGYQFFQFWGENAENEVAHAAKLISEKLGLNLVLS